MGTANPLVPLLIGVLTAMGFVVLAGLGVVNAWDVGSAGTTNRRRFLQTTSLAYLTGAVTVLLLGIYLHDRVAGMVTSG